MKKERTELETILYDEQYRLKLNLVYFLLDTVGLILLVVCCLIFRDIGKALTTFVFASLIAYKYFFHYTKDGDHFKILTFDLLSKILPKIRAKA